jgi:hypothetical protein
MLQSASRELQLRNASPVGRQDYSHCFSVGYSEGLSGYPVPKAINGRGAEATL